MVSHYVKTHDDGRYIYVRLAHAPVRCYPAFGGAAAIGVEAIAVELMAAKGRTSRRNATAWADAAVYPSWPE